jgi:hypothetical protein
MFLKTLLLSIILVVSGYPNAIAAEIMDLSHVHNIKIIGDRILFGTHEGLYEYKNMKNIQLVSGEKFDVMGLNVSNNLLFASGHPGINSKLPQPVGLLKSIDGGKKWKKVSLQGEVDFHLLEVSKNEIYGGDSGSGDLLYSKDLGKTWSKQGKNTFLDIAPNPSKAQSAIAIRQGKLFKTDNAFKSSKAISLKTKVSGIEWNTKRLIASSGRELLASADQGDSWKKVYTFDQEIAVLSHSTALIVVASGASIYTSIDNGKTFQSK